MYIHICIYIYICIHIYIYTHYVCMCVCVYISLYTYTYAYIYIVCLYGPAHVCLTVRNNGAAKLAVPLNRSRACEAISCLWHTHDV